MTNLPFVVRPRHWWNYLNPGWWKTKRTIEALIAYQWDHGVRQEVEETIKRHVLYGEALVPKEVS